MVSLGARAAEALAGVGCLDCGMEQDQKVSGARERGRITAGLCDNKKANPTGVGAEMLSRAICDHPEMCETLPHASCSPR